VCAHMVHSCSLRECKKVGKCNAVFIIHIISCCVVSLVCFIAYFDAAEYS